MMAGVLLSQVMYWDSKMKGNEFYKNDSEFMQETRLTQSEFKTAKKIITDLPFITIQRKGVPCRTWYSVNHTNLLVVLQQFSSSFTYELGSRLSTSQRGVNLRTIIGTENTQKNTTENTTVVEKEFSTVLIEADEELVMEIHHVPDYFDTEQKKPKEKKVAPKKEKVANPAPTRAMFQHYEQKYAELNRGEKPIWQDKYAPALKKLHEILTARCAQKGIIQLDPLQPWKDFVDIWAQYLNSHSKEQWHRDNFNPMTMYSQFNGIIAKLNAQPVKVQSERMDKWEKWAIDNGIKQTV
jgi:hypothetical protein